MVFCHWPLPNCSVVEQCAVVDKMTAASLGLQSLCLVDLDKVLDLYLAIRLFAITKNICRIINTIVSIWREKKLTNLFSDIICFAKLTVFFELRSWETVRRLEQIITADKYSCMFLYLYIALEFESVA